jgi:hypothetical protein
LFNPFFTGHLAKSLSRGLLAEQMSQTRVDFRQVHLTSARERNDGRKIWRAQYYDHDEQWYNSLLHDLRRTFITDAENAGAPRHQVMKLGGRRSESSFLRCATGNRERGRATVARIEGYRQESFGHKMGAISAIEKKE